MWLVVGLGNPGSEYAGNRHNVGFMVADELIRRGRGATPRAKFGAELAETAVGAARALVCKPMEFMNVSGQAVSKAATFWKVPAANTVVLYDDLDIPFGRMKLGVGGGHGGHNGVRSILTCLGTPEFLRVRIGIGRPPAGWDPANYVLANFSKEEQKELPFVVGEAADAVEAIVGNGLTSAMNKFNTKKKPGT